MHNNKPAIIVVLGSIFLSIIVLWLPLAMKLRIESSFEKVDAVVNEFRIDMKMHESYGITMSYSYMIKGRTYMSNKCYPVEMFRSDKGSIESVIKRDSLSLGKNWCYVNRENPTVSYMRSGNISMLQWVSGIGIILLILVLVIYRIRQ